MNSTSADYLNDLSQNVNRLAETLNNKGVNASADEGLSALVGKVGRIHSEVVYGEWVPLESTDTFSVSGIPFLPAKIGISCEQAMTSKIVAAGKLHVGLLNAEFTEEEINLYLNDSGTMQYEFSDANAEISVLQAEDGAYSVSVSFAAHNSSSDSMWLFRHSLPHMWVISSEVWKV